MLRRASDALAASALLFLGARSRRGRLRRRVRPRASPFAYAANVCGPGSSSVRYVGFSRPPRRLGTVVVVGGAVTAVVGGTMTGAVVDGEPVATPGVGGWPSTP